MILIYYLRYPLRFLQLQVAQFQFRNETIILWLNPSTALMHFSQTRYWNCTKPNLPHISSPLLDCWSRCYPHKIQRLKSSVSIVRIRKNNVMSPICIDWQIVYFHDNSQNASFAHKIVKYPVCHSIQLKKLKCQFLNDIYYFFRKKETKKRTSPILQHHSTRRFGWL